MRDLGTDPSTFGPKSPVHLIRRSTSTHCTGELCLSPFEKVVLSTIHVDQSLHYRRWEGDGAKARKWASPRPFVSLDTQWPKTAGLFPCLTCMGLCWHLKNQKTSTVTGRYLHETPTMMTEVGKWIANKLCVHLHLLHQTRQKRSLGHFFSNIGPEQSCLMWKQSIYP